MARGRTPGSEAKGSRAKKPSTKDQAPSTQGSNDDDVGRYDESIARHILVAEERNQQIAEETYTDNFFQYLEANGGLGIDPLSDEAVRIQAQYITKGVHPLDILRRLASNPFLKASDRIAAARTVLEYTARKVPSQIEVKDGDSAPVLRLTAQQIAKLSDKELDQLESLLRKAGTTETKT